MAMQAAQVRRLWCLESVELVGSFFLYHKNLGYGSIAGVGEGWGTSDCSLPVGISPDFSCEYDSTFCYRIIGFYFIFS